MLICITVQCIHHLLARYSPWREDVEISKSCLIRICGIVGIRILEGGLEEPVWLVLLDPLRELPVPHMLACPVLVYVAGIDDYKAPSRFKQPPHVSIEHRILHEMVDHIERQRQIACGARHCGVQLQKLFRCVTGEESTTHLHCLRRDVHARIARYRASFSCAPSPLPYSTTEAI